MDFIDTTEFEAWTPAFSEGAPTLMHLANRYAPNALIIANGSLHDTAKAEAVFADSADIATLGRAALANPHVPFRLAEANALREFDSAILGPVAASRKANWRCSAQLTRAGCAGNNPAPACQSAVLNGGFGRCTLIVG